MTLDTHAILYFPSSRSASISANVLIASGNVQPRYLLVDGEMLQHDIDVQNPDDGCYSTARQPALFAVASAPSLYLLNKLGQLNFKLSSIAVLRESAA